MKTTIEMKKTAAAIALAAANCALVAGAASPAAEQPPEQFPVRVNQAGYLPRAPKWCAMRNPPKDTFLVQRGDTDIHWHTVYEGKWVDAPSGGGLKLGDFSCVVEPGDYRILCGELKGDEKFRMPNWRPAMQSFHFQVRESVYDVAERLFVMYATLQRCGSKKGWAGLCHMDPVPVKDANGATVRHIDAHGGYHQSNDLRNWHDGISLSMYTLLRYAELKKPLWDDGEIAENIRWGCDYFLRVIAPEGYVYDAQFAPIGWQPRDYYLAPAALGAQCNVAMLLSRASRFFRPSDAAYADRLLAAARRVWNAIETNPFFEKVQPSPAKNLPPGSQPAERFYFQQWRTSVNGISERAMAALDLYLATGEEQFADKAKALGAEMVAHLAREGENAGWYMAEDGTRALRDCSYCTRASGFRVPIELYRTFGGAMWKDAALCVAERIARDIEKGDNWNADRNACKGPPLTQSFDTCYLLDCAELFGRGDFLVWAQRSFDWIFGMNLWNASYVECVGQNQWQRPVFGQFFPSTPQIPGGVLHTSHGEYDMPPVMATLLASACLEKAVRARQASAGDPVRVALTFDDSLKDHLLIAAPMLEERGWRGTFNLVTDWVGKGDKFLTWDDVRELVRRGHEVTTHTKTHPNLVKTLEKQGGEAAVRREFAESRDAIADAVGFTPRYMCSPGVKQNEETARLSRDEGLRQMMAGRMNFGQGTEGRTRQIIESRIASGARRLDILHHGISAKDRGGWRPFRDREAFKRHLDDLAALEREGKIVVTDYDGMVSDCRLAAREWPRHGVLALSFDDRNMAAWERAFPLFEKHGASATFFICGEIGSNEVAFAQRALSMGHEVGLHGLRHRNADDAVAKLGPDGYWKAEIAPQLSAFREAGVPIRSFAYPNCRRNAATDAVFAAHGFTRVRGTPDGVTSPNPHDPKGERLDKWRPVATSDAVFVPAAKQLTSLLIGNVIMGENYHTDIEDIMRAMRRAGERAETLSIVSHGIKPNAKGISMKTEWLERMLSEAGACGVVVRGVR